MRFGPYVGGQTALYYTSSDNGGVMMQVVCDGCVTLAAELPTEPKVS
jgi:hypothetical protein